MNPYRLVALLLLCLAVTACGGTASQEAVVASTATSLPDPAPTLTTPPEVTPASVQEEVATAAPAEAAEAPEADAPAETDWLTVEGKTEDNLSFLGNPEAPVTLIDYSDFL